MPARPQGGSVDQPLEIDERGVGSQHEPGGVDRERFERHRDRSEFYPYTGPAGEARVHADRLRGNLRVIDLTFPSPLPCGRPVCDTVAARFFVGDDAPRGPQVVFLHGLGARRLGFWDSQAAGLAERGFPTLLVCLPHTCERVDRGERAGYAYTSTHASLALPAYEQAVADTRAALDWLLSDSPCASLGKGDAPGPSIVGVSLGALIAVIAAALEPRLESVVPMLGGGDLDVIVFKGGYRAPVRRELRNARIRRENRLNARRVYEEYLEDVRRAESPLDVRPEFHFFLFDPLTFASSLRSRPALMVNALLDPVMPREAALQLWQELGRPEVCWLWGTHWTGGPWKSFVMTRLSRFLSGLRPGERRTPADGYATARPRR